MLYITLDGEEYFKVEKIDKDGRFILNVEGGVVKIPPFRVIGIKEDNENE